MRDGTRCWSDRGDRAVVVDHTRSTGCAASSGLVRPCRARSASRSIGPSVARHAGAVVPPARQSRRYGIRRAGIEHASPAPGVGHARRTSSVGHALVTTVTVTRGGIGALNRRDRIGGASGDDVSARAVGVCRALGAWEAICAIESRIALAV